MKQQGDSSIWKSLAVAFGDGLAFGVGVKIAQASARARAASPPAELPPAPAEPPEPIDLQVLSKVLAAIDARMAQSETKIAADLKAVEIRQVEHDAASQAALEHIHESMLRRVDAVEHDAQTVEARLAAVIQAAVEERLRHDINEAADRTATRLVEMIDARLLGRIESLEAEVRSQKETIGKLREAADGSQKKLHDALEGIGRACQTAIDELKKPESSAEGGSGPEAPPAEPAAAEAEDRRFDSLKLVNPARPERKLPIPLVSSLAVFVVAMATLF
jgi:hypothetical protein